MLQTDWMMQMVILFMSLGQCCFGSAEDEAKGGSR